MKKAVFGLLALLPFITSAESIDPNDFYAQQPSQNYQQPAASEQQDDADNSSDQTAAIVLNLGKLQTAGEFCSPPGSRTPIHWSY
ncbi:hypothetical protein IE969_27800 [Klebsiella pneumoniae]|nr:hypothetical protein [Klebsiella pneumoniae]